MNSDVLISCRARSSVQITESNGNGANLKLCVPCFFSPLIVMTKANLQND